MAKKGDRITVVLECEESGQVNYVTRMNKKNPLKKIKKFCRSLRKHTRHKVKEKMK